ncbi:MAG: hypothetical protein KAJ19_04305 [Gammaproteobacteria bacterium]|nr:hypothetical protein [Gammaproteobacteria bacterium]
MDFTRKLIKDKHFVLTLIRNGANDRQLEEHIRTLTDEAKDIHPFVELADASELHDLSGFTERGVTIAGAMEIDRKPHKEDKLAILVSNDEAHKLAIGYTATSVYARSDAKIFRDFRQAIEWLGVANLENKINELRQE